MPAIAALSSRPVSTPPFELSDSLRIRHTVELSDNGNPPTFPMLNDYDADEFAPFCALQFHRYHKRLCPTACPERATLPPKEGVSDFQTRVNSRSG